MIAFLIVAWVVFWISRVFIKPELEPEPVPTKQCPFCLEDARAAATKCPHCGSTI